MRTVASFPWGARSISASPLTISKLYKILEILRIKVLKIKMRIFKIKGREIKVRKHAEATGALADISADAPSEGRLK